MAEQKKPDLPHLSDLRRRIDSGEYPSDEVIDRTVEAIERALLNPEPPSGEEPKEEDKPKDGK